MVFGVSLRAVVTGLLAIPFSIILGEFMGYLLPLWNTNHWLLESFQALTDSMLAIVLLSCLVMVIANAVTRSEVGR